MPTGRSLCSAASVALWCGNAPTGAIISWWEIAFCGGPESEESGGGDVFGKPSLSVEHGVSRGAGVAVEPFACDPQVREIGPANC